jgi:hypothetical protein
VAQPEESGLPFVRAGMPNEAVAIIADEGKA